MRHVDIIHGAASPALCDALIAMHDHATKHGGSHRVEETWRRCTIVNFPQGKVLGSGELFLAFKAALEPHVKAYQSNRKTLNFCTLIEQPSVVAYDPVGAEPEHFHEHADAWSVESATRVVSIILFLNDVKDGGETVFPDLDIRSPPQRGKLLLFPSAFTHTHLALAPKSEKKYVVVTWLHFGGEVKYACLPWP